MTNRELLETVKHRPWTLPDDQWKFYQEWNKAIFLHWQADQNILCQFVPTELELDLNDGIAWVSLVAFTMEKIRPRILPSFPPISNFDEINIRTYVKAGNKSGVYFLSIEAGKKLSTWIARSLSELPYRYSSISRDNAHYQSFNTQFGDEFSIDFDRLESKIIKTKLDKWLTERYALFQDSHSGINKFEIHHLEWPIEKIQINNLNINYLRFSALLNDKPDLAHYSKGVKVIAWDNKKLATI